MDPRSGRAKLATPEKCIPSHSPPPSEPQGEIHHCPSLSFSRETLLVAALGTFGERGINLLPGLAELSAIGTNGAGDQAALPYRGARGGVGTGGKEAESGNCA